MPPALFLQSDLSKPYETYETMRSSNPVYWDEQNKLWAIYNYNDCVSVLNNTAAAIPPVDKSGLNEYALRIGETLARLGNGLQHAIARDAAMQLVGRMKRVSTGDTMDTLIIRHKIDWVDTVCKKLPVMVILKALFFEEKEISIVSGKTDQLIKIMLPCKTVEQVVAINETATAVYQLVEEHLSSSAFLAPVVTAIAEKYHISNCEALAVCVSNLIGLVIQGYDAGRGILSNTLLPLLKKTSSVNKATIEKSIIETLRFDPPVHNTRRIATVDIQLPTATIKQGEAILLVLASANRDPKKFTAPGKYDIERTNNHEHLTFGTGHHMCIANHFTMSLVTGTFLYLFEQFKKIRLTEQEIQYEPLVNVRLPKKMVISLQQ